MTKIHAPKSHPRYLSNYYRDLLVEGVAQGITSQQGLIAHGRGETFDYLLGEKTQNFAKSSIRAAASMLILAKHPVVSINGNIAVLVPKDLIKLSKIIDADIEVNIFHRSKTREQKIVKHLKKRGADKVLLPGAAKIPGIQSNRRMINSRGQAKADVVFVPLEDGDRTEALIAMGKKVITIDLNPLSRTAQKATITIVDNIVRALPLIIEIASQMKEEKRERLEAIIKDYSNQRVLKQSLQRINKRLKQRKIKVWYINL